MSSLFETDLIKIKGCPLCNGEGDSPCHECIRLHIKILIKIQPEIDELYERARRIITYKPVHRILWEEEHLKGWSLSEIKRGRGCQECQQRGYTISTYRDEVRDEETLWTCLRCLDPAEKEYLRNKYYTKE